MSDDSVTARLNADTAELPSALYNALRRLAQSQLARDRQMPTLNATALVNEAYAKLAEHDPHWQSRGHFMASMARVMRHVLIDYARERQAERRGGDQQRITFEHAADEPRDQMELCDMLAIDQALAKLRALDARAEQVFELHLFAGMTAEEIAAQLGLSVPTVKRDLRAARAYIGTQLPTP